MSLSTGPQHENKYPARLLDGTQPTHVTETAVLLKNGHLIVCPTDTVYGIAANAFDNDAIAQLYRVKQRPFDKGIPLLLADLTDLEAVAHSIPDLARDLIQRYWPGPLTLIVPRRSLLPPALSPNDNIAVRIPDCDITRAVIRQAGGAVAATSANLSGQPPAQTAAEGMAALGHAVAVVLDGGPAPQGIASTVLDCTAVPPAILRPGPLTAADLNLSPQTGA